MIAARIYFNPSQLPQAVACDRQNDPSMLGPATHDWSHEEV
jgi:hypothetical protein